MARKREKVLDGTPATPESANARKEEARDRLVDMMREIHSVAYTDTEIEQAAFDIVELEYPGLRQNIPEILKAILKELILRRKGA